MYISWKFGINLMSEKDVIYIFKNFQPLLKNSFDTKSTIWKNIYNILDSLKIYIVT
jgi:hypothetical protein